MLKKVYVEITNTCNLACGFCRGTVRAPRETEPADFAVIAAKLRPYTEYIYLHLLGEPLTHTRLEEILATTDRKTRNQKLMLLEQMFVTDSPATALVTYKNNYLASSELSGLSGNVYGYTEFTNATLKNYKAKNAAYEEAQAAAEAAGN